MLKYVSKWAIPIMYCFLALGLVSSWCVLVAAFFESNHYVGLAGMVCLLTISLLFFVVGFGFFVENIFRKRNFESSYVTFTKGQNNESDSYFFCQLINLCNCGLGVYFIYKVLRVMLNFLMNLKG